MVFVCQQLVERFIPSIIIKSLSFLTNRMEPDLVEVIGYIGRALSSREAPNFTLGPYIMQSILLLLSPALFAASVYMELARIIALVEGEKYSIVPRRWLTKIFVVGDVASFITQGSGKR